MQPLPSLVPVRPALNRDGGRWAFRQAFYTLTFSYPVLWTIGAGGLYWILLAAPALWYLLRTRFSGLFWGVLAIPAILLLSSPIGLVGTSAGPTRLIGLAANIYFQIRRDRRETAESRARIEALKDRCGI